jgi:predicted anti-sigma-YlaC factor YlaD
MKGLDCEFESDVLAAVLEARWPGRADAELRAHVETCTICRDVATVAAALEGDPEELRAEAAVPDCGLVWWRAQLRARREAAKVAGRPITAAQVMALASAAGLAGACFGATSAWFQAVLGRIATGVHGMPIETLLAEHGFVAAAAGAVLLLVPAAVVLAILRD